MKEFEQQYQDGLITAGERYNKVVDAWSRCTDEVAGAMMKEISKQEVGVPTNSVWMMSHSGARGSPAQMRQLAGMRGLMAKPSGEIIEQPIIANFKEGLSVLEYFNSTHGARKGLADTALKTANSGYLTRRLVDVAQDCIIVEEDCGTERGLTVRAVMDGGEVVSALSERILGRTTAEDVLDPVTNEVLVAGQHADRGGRGRRDREGRRRGGEDPLGADLRSRGRRVRPLLRARPRARHAGEYRRGGGRDRRAVDRRAGHAADDAHVPHRRRGAAWRRAVERRGEPRRHRHGQEPQRGDEQPGHAGGDVAQLRDRADRRQAARARALPRAVRRAAAGRRGPAGRRAAQKLAEWDPYTLPIITERAGKVEYIDLIEGITLVERMDEVTGLTSKVVVDYKQGAEERRSAAASAAEGRAAARCVRLPNGTDARYFLAPDSILSVDNGAMVAAGDVLARIPREGSKTRDITGGLPRVAELFEARRPKDHAVIAETDGRVEFGKDYKAKRRVIVKNDETGEETEYLIPKGKHVSVQEGDFVRRGDPLVDGPRVPHDILKVLGVEALSDYLVNEIQDVYRLQGVKINDKHIEVIVRQMLQKVEILDPGDTTFLTGEQVDRTEFDAVNAKLVQGRASGGGDAGAAGHHQGVSLQTNSFISAASFQETTRVLTEAATAGKADTLMGLKENVIVGRLIPAGTGAVMNRLRVDRRGPRSADAEHGHGAADHRRGEGGGVGASSPTDHQKAGALNALRPFFCGRIARPVHSLSLTRNPSGLMAGEMACQSYGTCAGNDAVKRLLTIRSRLLTQRLLANSRRAAQILARRLGCEPENHSANDRHVIRTISRRSQRAG